MPADRLAAIAVLLPWWLLTLGFGGVYPWVWSAAVVLVATAAAVTALGASPAPRGVAPRLRTLRAPWLAVACFAALQACPLPPFLGDLAVSAGGIEAAAWYEIAHPPAGAGIAGWFPAGWTALSVRPGRTLLFLLAWLLAGLWVRAACVAVAGVGLEAFTRVAVATLGIVSVLTLAHHLAGDPAGGYLGWVRQRPAGVTSAPLLNPNSQAEWVVLLCGPAAALCLRAVSGARSGRDVLERYALRPAFLLPAAALAVGFASLFALASLAGLACAAFIVVVALRAAGMPVRRLVGGVAPLGIGAFLMAGFVIQRDLFAKLLAFGDSSAGRPVIWMLGLQTWAAAPWVGHGLDTFGIASLPLQHGVADARVLSPHNLGVEVLADGGLVLAVLLVWFGWRLWLLVRRPLVVPRPRGYVPVAAGASWSIAAFVLPLAVGIPLHVPAVAITFALLVVFLVVDPCRSVRSRGSRTAGAPVLLGVSEAAAVPAR